MNVSGTPYRPPVRAKSIDRRCQRELGKINVMYDGGSGLCQKTPHNFLFLLRTPNRQKGQARQARQARQSKALSIIIFIFILLHTIGSNGREEEKEFKIRICLRLQPHYQSTPPPLPPPPKNCHFRKPHWGPQVWGIFFPR